MKGVRSGLRSVAADDDKAGNVFTIELAKGFDASFFFVKFGAPGTAKHGASALDDSTNIAGTQRDEVSIYQSQVALTDADDVPAFGDSGAGDGANGGIHAGCVSAARKHSNFLHLFLRSIRMLT